MTLPRRLPFLALVLALASLGGCKSGPDFKRPDPPKAERFTAQALQVESKEVGGESPQRVAAGEELDRAWWLLFQSSELDAVVRDSLANNRTIAAAGFTLAQAQELAAARAGKLAPQLAMTAGIGKQKFGRQLLGDAPSAAGFSYFSVGPTVAYALDYAGGGARAVEQQYALSDFRRHQLEAARLAVSGNAVMESLRIASLRVQVATVETLLDQDRENVKLVREAFAAGAVSRLDIVSAESQLASDTALLPPIRQELAMAQHALSIVMGRTPAAGGIPDLDLTRIALPRRVPLSVPSELAHRRPDILSAEAELHAATAALGVATANLYPRIDLSASFLLQGAGPGQLFGGGNNGWTVLGGLMAPIFDGGTLQAERRAAADAVLAGEARYQQTVLTAFGQVADSLRALEHGAEAFDALARAQQAAYDNLDLTRKSYRAGNVGVLQVLDAQRRYQQARLGYVRARGQRYLDTAQLFLALGGNGPEVGGAPPPAAQARE